LEQGHENYVVAYHPPTSAYFVKICGFFPKARSIFERIERAYCAFVGTTPVLWDLEKKLVAQIVAKYNVEYARQNDPQAAEVLNMDSVSLSQELKTSA